MPHARGGSLLLLLLLQVPIPPHTSHPPLHRTHPNPTHRPPRPSASASVRHTPPNAMRNRMRERQSSIATFASRFLLLSTGMETAKESSSYPPAKPQISPSPHKTSHCFQRRHRAAHDYIVDISIAYYESCACICVTPVPNIS